MPGVSVEAVGKALVNIGTIQEIPRAVMWHEVATRLGVAFGDSTNPALPPCAQGRESVGDCLPRQPREPISPRIA
jgi:hypothetical protein